MYSLSLKTIDALYDNHCGDGGDQLEKRSFYKNNQKRRWKIPPYKWKEIDDEAFRRRKYRQMAMKNSVTENIENGDEKFRPANKKKLTMKHSVAENIDKWRWKIPSQKIQINGDETFRPKNKKKLMKHSVSKNNQDGKEQFRPTIQWKIDDEGFRLIDTCQKKKFRFTN